MVVLLVRHLVCIIQFPLFTLCNHMHLTYTVVLTQGTGEGTQTMYIKYRVKNRLTVTPKTSPFVLVSQVSV